jgi:pyruvate formate lyase activating enzyme
MIIGGFQKFSLIDFPGRVAAVVFTQGCNFRCPYCHNPQLVEPAPGDSSVSEETVLSFLATRTGKLEGVVVTGGEPTLQPDLERFLARLKALGFAVKLDTNGSAPHVLQGLLCAGLVDYVAMDLKASAVRYAEVAGAPVEIEDLRASIRAIFASGVAHELRMTFLERILPPDEIPAVAELARGCGLFVIQPFLPSTTLEPRMRSEARPTIAQMEAACAHLKSLGLPARVRA